MNTEKKQKVLEILKTGRYVFADGKIYNRAGKELFTTELSSGYIQCTIFNGKRGNGNIKVIVYKHILIYMNTYGYYDDNLVIDHINGDCRDNRIENLQAVSQSANKLKSPKQQGVFQMRPIRSDSIAEIKRMLDNGVRNYSQIARTLNLNRCTTMYVAKKILAGAELKYENK